MKLLLNVLKLIKFSHTIFALPFAIIGVGLAYKFGYQISFKLLILVIACMVFARSAAMAFNRYLDRHIDALNPRTQQREIPAGIISPTFTLIFVIVNCLAFLICTYFINFLCFCLAPIALFVVLLYSYTKRFTMLCHLVLGLGLSLAPIGSFVAITNEFNLASCLFSLVVLTWVSGFDIIYALQDVDFDQSQKLKSIPAYFGIKGSISIARVLHFITCMLVLSIGVISVFHLFYWIGALLFCACLAYQHTLVKPNNLSKIQLSFFTTNGIASVVFAVFCLLDFMLYL